jgi:hypothetical protein
MWGRREYFGLGTGPAAGASERDAFLKRLPQYRMPGRWPRLALDKMEPFVRSRLYDWRVQSFPIGSALSVAAGAQVEDQASVDPGSFLLMVSASSEQAAGFRFEILDAGTKKTLDSYTLNFRNGAGSGSGAAQNSPFLFPAGGHIAIVQGLYIVRLVNLDVANANRIELVLFFAQPRQRTMGGPGRV